ncbi:uncharacterized protein LOC125504599 [Dendroctonus ponderosae]|uniref:uncharacterized protein LOC109545511 n=1 Tax=Dendroctonus ponderosae TaxID=77166 RepID=UPI0020359B5C|nr:uncharacterized protein LOC109545511 [Dendroctonus ponderosae]XP_048522783.1 uncharacterized protein LOC125504599 [Dendroctonus ponderosae]KAH1017697.1 hypothetical protein HUJ05_008302 [Dendroctonus ponderosae]KAH1017698.1 hypothetical protein HUJ05_008302 [Dendroctonus ponderosae]KAH1017723.1 hypothetical protein HUJ05_008324 [Dendroctonus ponderosae]KAH1017724.1 hypothetical protein HUJ05_008324 [Dendroctonus ponderosae]
MGCVNSKADINDTHPNIFHVINVDDRDRPVNRGKLEVTDVELIWHQKGSNPTRWPLRSLRRYGFDLDRSVFSIECGRRSPTGPGYFAFKCIKCEQLFKLVQLHIIGGVQDVNVMSGDNSHLVHNPNQNNIDFSVLGASSGPPVQRRPDGHLLPAIADATHLNPAQPIIRSHAGVLSRPGSISSNGGHLSPTALSPPPVLTSAFPLEHNNNKRHSSIVENGISSPLNYANVGPGDVEANCHVYVNVDTKDIGNSVREELHCYANIDTRDVDSIHALQQQHSSVSNVAIPNKDSAQMYMSNSVPCTPTAYETEHAGIPEVNYAELDLDQVKNDLNGNAGTSSQATVTQTAGAQGSPTLQKKSYALIDFPKTIALSQSINPNADLEEGSRKTRHNSTINSFSD